MPRFEVVLSYNVIQRKTATVRIEAADQEAAKDLAVQIRKDSIQWRTLAPVVTGIDIFVTPRPKPKIVSTVRAWESRYRKPSTLGGAEKYKSETVEKQSDD